MGRRVTPSFLALGDSYTVGEGVPVADRWPVQLAARLRGAGTDVAEPRIVAQTGWTAEELAMALQTSTFAPPYALVSLQVGVNDQYRGLQLAAYRERFGALLARAVALAGGAASRVLVVSIPDWGVTPFARNEGRDPERVAREIDAFNAIGRAEADAMHAQWIDVTGISRAPDARNALAGDGLHPSGAQYARWVEAILPAARAALGGG